MRPGILHLLSAAVLLIILSSCVKTESLPVSRQSLIGVLADVHVAESALMSYNDPEKDSLATIYYRQILTIHDMDREVFDTSLAILRRNPDLMNEIYGEVLEHLEKEKIQQE